MKTSGGKRNILIETETNDSVTNDQSSKETCFCAHLPLSLPKNKKFKKKQHKIIAKFLSLLIHLHYFEAIKPIG